MKYIKYVFPALVVLGVAWSVGLYALAVNIFIPLAISHKGGALATIANLYAHSPISWVIVHELISLLLYFAFLIFLGSCRTALSPKPRLLLLGIVFVISVPLILLVFPA